MSSPHQGAIIDPSTVFDAQAKRLHEYKRQLMNALGILMFYNLIVDHPEVQFTPRTYLFGAKASPGYYRAKLIIKLINSIGELVNKHPRASKLINVVFLENYCVSLAEILMPATEISEQLSTAGKEASGTGNMKFMMNGAVTVGTMDGANCEIHDAVGDDNIFIFGLRADEVEEGYSKYRASEIYETNPSIRRAMDQLINGDALPGEPSAVPGTLPCPALWRQRRHGRPLLRAQGPALVPLHAAPRGRGLSRPRQVAENGGHQHRQERRLRR